MRFPGFEGEWVSFALGQLCEEFQSGKGIKSDQIKDLGSYPVYGGNGLRGYTDSYNHEGVYTLIGRQGAKCGNVRLVSGRTYITEHAVAVKANQANVTEFLNWLFIKMDLGQYSDQSAQPGLAVNKLVRLNAFVPKKEEQKRIADLMTLIDARIAIQNKVIEKYESLIKALCHHLFSVGRDDVKRISDLGEYFSTMNLSKNDLSFSGEDCILYGELFTTYGRIITEIKSRTNKRIGAVRSHNTDLLFPASTTVDALSLISPAAITKEGVILGGDMFGIRIQPNLDNRYLSYLLYYCYREKFAGYAQGSTIIHLHYNDIKNIEIRVHDNATQKRIAQLLSILETMRANQEQALSYYSTQKAFLLKELFI